MPSVEVAGAIRGIQETDETREFIKALRGMLYNLEGPFARPQTFAGAADDRIILALDDLEPSNPLVARLWEMSLEWEGVFAPRSINLSVREDEVLKEASPRLAWAASC